MREVIITEQCDKVLLSNVAEYTPIFAKQDGYLCGMVTKEDRNPGWILRIGASSGATGYYHTREECLESCLKHGYTFFIS